MTKHVRLPPRDRQRQFAYPEDIAQPREIELVLAPGEEGGYHVYAPDTLEEATANAQEAVEHYVEGLRGDGRSFDVGVIRRRFPVRA
jgi:predicted RNase H-like HicB family nuclease